MSVPHGNVVADGLCMPHSPRWHEGSLLVLDSGTGRLLRVGPATGQSRAIATELPGFARGLGLCGAYAFIGLSKIRVTSAMDGVPLAGRRDVLKCGVAVVDLRTGGVVASVEFQSAVEEVFDVQVLAGLRIDPDVSPPGAPSSNEAARAAAEPPLDPPGLRVRSHGFWHPGV